MRPASGSPTVREPAVRERAVREPTVRERAVRKRAVGRRGLMAVVFALVGAGACTIAPAPEGAPAPGDGSGLPPPGYGTLRQDAVSIGLVSQGLQILVTPLEEFVTRVTAPDTYERLSGTARAHRPAAPPGSRLFLVSFYSDDPDTRFVPEDIEFISRGFRVRPVAISAVTPGWGQRRVGQRQTEMAVYAFPADLAMESDLVLVYGLDQSQSWSAILPRIQAETGRVRARAGSGDAGPERPGTDGAEGQGSRSYFEILR